MGHTTILLPTPMRIWTMSCKCLQFDYILYRFSFSDQEILTRDLIQSTSPSVYMVVNTIYGYNTAGRTGPSGTSVIFPLDLDEVSTIVPYASNTRQLSLSDLGTDCPQSEAPSEIATAAPDGRCDPVLVAPERVKAWASPCNACGNFGLFDPPYAVTHLTGGLVPATSAPSPQPEPSSTSSVVTATETAETTPSVASQSSVSGTELTSTAVTVTQTNPSSSGTGQTSSGGQTPSISSASSAQSSGSQPGSSTTPVFASAVRNDVRGLLWAAFGWILWLELA